MLFLLPFILTLYCSVGTSARSPESRIVGGHPISITERPFQVLVLQAVAKNKIFKCGGSIINHRWILTAAHCTVGASPKAIIIRAGTDNLTDTDSYEQYELAVVVSHENFTAAPNLSNDIALLMTTKNMEFGPTISSVKVTSVPPPASVEAVVSGFGVTEEGGLEGSNLLMAVSVETLDQESCRDLLPHGSPLDLDDSIFCAAHLEGGKDSCQGDSGGPITIDDVLVGVVSWGIGCAREGVPAFYTDVSRYISWITDTIKAYDSR